MSNPIKDSCDKCLAYLATMIVAVSNHINNDYLLVCVRTARARLINTDFLVLRYVLNSFVGQNIEPFLRIVDKRGPCSFYVSELTSAFFIFSECTKLLIWLLLMFLLSL